MLRLCWELVAATKARAADPLIEARRGDVLAAFDAVRAAVGVDVDVRVAALVELWEEPDHNLLRLCASLQKTARALRERGIGFDIWPQLEDQGRFLNTRTARTFSERLLPVLEAMRGEEVGVFLDMEPPLDTLESAWSLQNGAPVRAKAASLGRLVRGVAAAVTDARQGMRDLSELARDIAGVGLPVLTAIPPPVFPLDSFGADAVKRFVLGCPDDDGAGGALFGATAALCYAPLLRRRGADRNEQHRTLSLWAARHRERSTAICMGPLSTGLLGDEPCYAARAHFEDDLKAVLSLGYDDVTLYSGEGLLFGEGGEPNAGVRSDLSAWLSTLGLMSSTSLPASTSTLAA